MISAAEWGAVRGIIVVRSLQVGGIAFALLLALWFVVPPPICAVLASIGGLLVTVGLSWYFRAVFNPRTTWGFDVVTRLSSDNGRHWLLTFDDGPFPETTPAILEILATCGVTATFFVVAEQAARHPELIRQIASEGHQIGLHGLRHEPMVLKSGQQIARELAEGERVLRDIIGGPLPARWFRPPHGFKTWTLCRTVHRLGWTMVGWSVDSRDYDDLTADEIVARVRNGLSDGAIVLLHERPGRTETLEALPRILAREKP